MQLKKLILLLVLTLASNLTVRSQCLNINLIKNPGLEDYICCPYNFGMISCATDWEQPRLDGSTSEYFNICAIDSLLMPNTLPWYLQSFFGNGYAGIILDDYPYREYIQGNLSEPLIAGKCYYCSFYVKLFNYNKYFNNASFSAIDAISIYFSDTLPKQDSGAAMAMYLPAQLNNTAGRIISDTLNWTQIKGTFTANGGEKYFTVGTFCQESEVHRIHFFSPQLNLNYYFLDNFSLCPCTDTIPPPKPPEPPNIVYVPNVFTPNGDGKNDKLYLRGANIKEGSFSIYNRWGELMFKTQDVNEGWTGRYKNKDCIEGVYFYIANITFLNGEVTIKKGNITLIK